MREEENIPEVSQLDIDLMGFIFWPKSPRFAGDQLSIPTPVEGRTLRRVGVFVDEMPQTIISRIHDYALDDVQLHGHESRVMIENLKRTLIPDIAPHIKIIKALSVSSRDDVMCYKDYEGAVDLFLFDTKCVSRGGSGEHFDWSVLEAYDGDTPFLLSGGIGPADVARVRAFNHPRCVGIDVNSRFETSPGMKNVADLHRFIDAVRR